MKVDPKHAILGATGLVFLFPGAAPDELLKYGLGTMVGSFGVLLASLYAVVVDPVIGLAAFMAVASLYLEHRRRIMNRLRSNMYASKSGGTEGSLAALVAGSPPTQPGETHPSRPTPEYEDLALSPDEIPASSPLEESGLDGKQVLGTAGQETDAVREMLVEKGLAPNL
jgi:hypothetical protein